MVLCTAAFIIVEGNEGAVGEAAKALVKHVRTQEKGTWLYEATVHHDTLASPPTRYLVFNEGYVDDEALGHHLAKHSCFSRFAAEAARKNWLVKDPSNPTGLKSDFASLDLRGKLVSGTCSVGSV